MEAMLHMNRQLRELPEGNRGSERKKQNNKVF